MNKVAICPGSFDPVTFGHLDIIKRASKMFDHVIVAVLVNPSKNAMFTIEERIHMLRLSTAEIENLEIVAFKGLLADYAKLRGANILVRGLRAVTDFEYEFQMSLTNKKLNPELETVFLTTSAENMYLSSSIVKQVGSFGGDISNFVPDCIHDIITKKLSKED